MCCGTRTRFWTKQASGRDLFQQAQPTIDQTGFSIIIHSLTLPLIQPVTWLIAHENYRCYLLGRHRSAGRCHDIFCLRLPDAAAMKQAFEHLVYPAHFRIQLAVAKLLGVVLLLAP